MKYLSIFLVLFFATIQLSCDTLDDNDPTVVDPLISAEIADSQDYNLVTPVYGMQVSIDSRVNRNTQEVLNILDRRATQFLDCQFVEGSDLGFEDVELGDGSTVTPLSDLRVFVVPNRYRCDGIGSGVCNGTFFPPDTDIIVVTQGGFAGCDEFLAWKHEVAHRYGMMADHSDQGDFQSCIGTSSCDLGDIIDID